MEEVLVVAVVSVDTVLAVVFNRGGSGFNRGAVPGGVAVAEAFDGDVCTQRQVGVVLAANAEGGVGGRCRRRARSLENEPVELAQPSAVGGFQAVLICSEAQLDRGAVDGVFTQNVNVLRLGMGDVDGLVVGGVGGDFNGYDGGVQNDLAGQTSQGVLDGVVVGGNAEGEGFVDDGFDGNRSWLPPCRLPDSR